MLNTNSIIFNEKNEINNINDEKDNINDIRYLENNNDELNKINFSETNNLESQNILIKKHLPEKSHIKGFNFDINKILNNDIPNNLDIINHSNNVDALKLTNNKLFNDQDIESANNKLFIKQNDKILNKSINKPFNDYINNNSSYKVNANNKNDFNNNNSNHINTNNKIEIDNKIAVSFKNNKFFFYNLSSNNNITLIGSFNIYHIIKYVASVFDEKKQFLKYIPNKEYIDGVYLIKKFLLNVYFNKKIKYLTIKIKNNSESEFTGDFEMIMKINNLLNKFENDELENELKYVDDNIKPLIKKNIVKLICTLLNYTLFLLVNITDKIKYDNNKIKLKQQLNKYTSSIVYKLSQYSLMQINKLDNKFNNLEKICNNITKLKELIINKLDSSLNELKNNNRYMQGGNINNDSNSDNNENSESNTNSNPSSSHSPSRIVTISESNSDSSSYYLTSNDNKINLNDDNDIYKYIGNDDYYSAIIDV